MRKYTINWVRLLFGAVYAVWETKYFGWHEVPVTNAEIICDGIVFLLLVLSIHKVEEI